MSSFELKELAYRHRIALWKIADRIGVHENTLIRWLRKDLTEDKQKIVLNAITEIIAERTKF